MIDKVVNNLQSLVEEHGWAVMCVGADDVTPSYSYSIGFSGAFNCPEVVIVGLRPEVAHTLLHQIANGLQSGQISLTAEGGESDKVLQGYVARFKPMQRETILVICHMIQRTLGDKDFDTVQMIYPDQDGKFPGDTGCSLRIAEIQDLQPIINGYLN